MKSTLSAIFIACLWLGNLQAQNDSVILKYRNVIGFDATLFVRQFLTNNSPSNYFYDAPYFLSYRRMCRNYNWRLGAGGSIGKSEDHSGDSIYSFSNKCSANVRIGLERQIFNIKRWGFYAGGDCFSEYFKSSAKRDVGWQQNLFIEQIALGVSPVAGIVYSINNRISLSTEVSLDFAFTHRIYVDHRVSNTAYYLYDRNESAGFGTSFNGMQMLNVRLSF